MHMLEETRLATYTFEEFEVEIFATRIEKESSSSVDVSKSSREEFYHFWAIWQKLLQMNLLP